LDKCEEAKTVLTRARDLDPGNETIVTSLDEVNTKIRSIGVGICKLRIRAITEGCSNNLILVSERRF